MEEDKTALVQSLIEMVNEIATISDYRCAVKKQYCNLARRLKLLIPMFEEIRDMKEELLPENTVKALISFREALESAKELLRFGSETSKIYLVCVCHSILHYFSSLQFLCVCLFVLLIIIFIFFIFFKKICLVVEKMGKVKEN